MQSNVMPSQRKWTVLLVIVNTFHVSIQDNKALETCFFIIIKMKQLSYSWHIALKFKSLNIVTSSKGHVTVKQLVKIYNYMV